MKEEVEILIEQEVVELAIPRAVEDDRALSDLIEEALVAYRSRKVPYMKKREEAHRIFCEEPIQISHDQFKELLKEDTRGR